MPTTPALEIEGCGSKWVGLDCERNMVNVVNASSVEMVVNLNSVYLRGNHNTHRPMVTDL